MTVIIDLGNTTAKICSIGAGGDPTDIQRFPLAKVTEALDHPPLDAAGHVIFASSASKEVSDGIIESLNQKSIKVLRLTREGPMPFESNYAAGQAGIDRLANVAAAINYATGPVIVVDAGSAITLEAIDENGVFLGGAIMPGMELQAAALHKGTGWLPQISVDASAPAIGTDTDSAIRTGIINGCAGAVERLLKVTLDQADMAAAAIIVTGGDGPLLTRLIASGVSRNIDLVPDLTLRGLYLLAKHQFPHELQNLG